MTVFLSQQSYGDGDLLVLQIKKTSKQGVGIRRKGIINLLEKQNNFKMTRLIVGFK